jgi:hypothetical protein
VRIDQVSIDGVGIEPVNDGVPLHSGDTIMRFQLPDHLASVHPSRISSAVPLHIGLDHAVCQGLDFNSTMNLINRDVTAVMEKFEPLFPAGTVL